MISADRSCHDLSLAGNILSAKGWAVQYDPASRGLCLTNNRFMNPQTQEPPRAGN
ncbi:MAG: hypothetical protein ABFE16_18965 [Armatimonadia bacterium]